MDALGPHVALGTDGIGADMFEESRAAYFRLREDDLASPPSWPLERLAEGASFVGAAFGESRFGRLEVGAPADLVVLDYAAPAPLRESSFAGHWIFGLSSRHVRDVMVGGEWVVRDRKLTRVDQQELAAEARLEAERLWKRLDDVGAHISSERRPAMAVATEPGSKHRVGLYLQDKHPIRDGMRYAQLAESCGFEAVWQAKAAS